MKLWTVNFVSALQTAWKHKKSTFRTKKYPHLIQNFDFRNVRANVRQSPKRMATVGAWNQINDGEKITTKMVWWLSSCARRKKSNSRCRSISRNLCSRSRRLPRELFGWCVRWYYFRNGVNFVMFIFRLPLCVVFALIDRIFEIRDFLENQRIGSCHDVSRSDHPVYETNYHSKYEWSWENFINVCAKTKNVLHRPFLPMPLFPADVMSDITDRNFQQGSMSWVEMKMRDPRIEIEHLQLSQLRRNMRKWPETVSTTLNGGNVLC